VTNLAEVPSTLKNIPNWISWKLIKKDGEDSKVPFIPGTVRHASSTDSSTWTTFETAIANTSVNGKEGVGFVIHGAAIDEQIVGFDLDGCRNPQTGEITSWAEAIVDQLDSYTEITPSGLGLRVWVKGKLPGKDRVFNLAASAGFGSKVKIEVFDKARYFTVTGDTFFDEPVEVETRDLTEAYKLCSEFKNRFPVNSAPMEIQADSSEKIPVKIKQTGTTITTKLHLLMTGKMISEKPVVIDDGLGNSIEFPSRSEADLSLCTGLALEHGNNPELIDAEFRKSCLYREKWERDSYRTPTISNAIKTAEKIKAEITLTTSAAGTPAVAEAVKAIVTVNGDDFMVEKIPPRKVLISTISANEPVIFEQSINQVFAWRGEGKTCLGLGFVRALATAGRFLNFKATERVPVLYIEGELPDSQFQERWRSIVGKTDGYAHMASLDKQPGHNYVSLASEVGMAKIEATLAELAAKGINIKVLMLDNISTLFNVKANEEEVWIGIQSWFTSLRSRGITVIFFHHAGKGGLSRSHSKSEDMLDVSIKLEAPDEPEQGHLHTVLTFDKARAGLSERPAEIKLHRVHSETCPCRKMVNPLFCPGDGVRWEHIPRANKRDDAYQMFAAGVAISDVATALAVPEGTVRMWRTKWGKAQQQQSAARITASRSRPE
jgi:hypothetical protein